MKNLFFSIKNVNLRNIINKNENLFEMKKLLLTVIATVLMASSISAQNVARECVLVEVFTGINCPYCPAAAGGVAEMVKQGLSIAPLAFHNSAFSPPTYATSETNGRASFYNVSGFPTAVIDGLARPAVAGPASNYLNSYYSLKAEYDKRMNVTSPYTIELSYDYHSGTKCQAKAIVKKVGECNGTDVRLFIALTESHIQQSWGGLSELNAVVRDVVTTPVGVVLENDEQEVTALFELAGYKKENCELVAWVQATSGAGREVYQAVKISIATESAEYDLGITSVENVPEGICSNIIRPRFTIRNYGSESITSVLFKVTDDQDQEILSQKWEGNLSQNATKEFIMPEINFAHSDYIRIEALDLNGTETDKYTIDNVFLYETKPSYVLPDDGLLKFQMKTDQNATFSVDIINMDKGELVHTITIPDANKLYKEDYVLPEYGCYRVVFKNSNGKGIGSNGFWGIINGNKKTIISGKPNENAFRYEFVFELSYGTTGVEDVEVLDVNVYPNPAKSVINITSLNLNRVSVFNSIGQMVYTQNVDYESIAIDTESWANGLYYVNVETSDGKISSQKVIVNK